MRSFDAAKVKETLECLTVEKCKLTLASQQLPKVVAARGTWDRKEAVYGTEFRVEKFSNEFLEAVSRSCFFFAFGCELTSSPSSALQAAKAVSLKEFALPEPNQFIPKDVHVDKVEGVEVSLLVASPVEISTDASLLFSCSPSRSLHSFASPRSLSSGTRRTTGSGFREPTSGSA